MTEILELRERIKAFYSKNEVFIVPVVKMLVAFLILRVMNQQLGYMAKLDSFAIVLILALACSFLPSGTVVLFGAFMSLAHLYESSLEVAVVALVLYLVMFMLFVRFQFKYSILLALTPVLFVMKIPYVIPIVVGLVATPAASLYVAGGVILHYFYRGVIEIAPNVAVMDKSEIVDKVRLIINACFGNKTMIVMAVIFALTVVVVYFIKRTSLDYAWTIAMIAGVLIELVMTLVGDLMYDLGISFGGAILGCLLAVIVAKGVEFFKFLVDYNRVENVQFEDDDYYYYVKAVPKMTVALSEKKVKKINSGSSVKRPRSVTIGRTEDARGTDGEAEDFEDLY